MKSSTLNNLPIPSAPVSTEGSRLVIIQADVLEALRKLPNGSVHCCVTSPPYWALRNYGVSGQIGLEKTPEEYAAKMVEVFREVRRVLRDDGTCWVNLGDSYASAPAGNFGVGMPKPADGGAYRENKPKMDWKLAGLKPKDLCGIPWRVAFALQADGWWLRQDIIWHKPNPMPESVTDRPTKAHEYVFLLSKNARYFYDAEAVKEECEPESWHNSDFRRERNSQIHPTIGTGERNARTLTRNKRSVWTIPTTPYSEAHFATFPPNLVMPCILAGTSARGCCPKCGAPWERIAESFDPGRKQKMADGWDTGNGGHGTIHRDGREKGESGKAVLGTRTTGWRPTCECGESTTVPCTVLDPFAGSGTTGMVALELGRKAILSELNPSYVELIRRRCDVTPGLPL